MTELLQRILPTVQKPARYTGGEFNEIKKNLEDVRVRVAFCFPDTYEIGMSNVGMRIREGDPLEIYTASDGEVIFKKYSPIGELSEFASQYTDVLNRATNLPVIITDRDHVIAASGMPKKDAMDKRISADLEELIENRENYVASPDIKALYPLKDSDREAGIAYPIIGGGDVAGAVVLMLNTNGVMPSQTEIKLVSVAASFLGKQTEE